MNDPRMKPVTVYSLMEIILPIDSEDPMLLQARAVGGCRSSVQRIKGCGNVKGAAEGIFNVKVGKTIRSRCREAAEAYEVGARQGRRWPRHRPDARQGGHPAARLLRQPQAHAAEARTSSCRPASRSSAMVINEKYDEVRRRLS